MKAIARKLPSWPVTIIAISGVGCLWLAAAGFHQDKYGMTRSAFAKPLCSEQPCQLLPVRLAELFEKTRE